jgi:Tfp pilus assembly protein PilN
MNPLPLNDKPATGSFLPEEYLARRAEMRASLLGMFLFGVVMFVVVGAFLATNRRWSSVKSEAGVVAAEYEEQKQKIEQLQRLEKDRDVMLEKGEIVSALVEKVPKSVLMSELVSRMPPGMTLLELNIEGKRPEPPKSKDDPKSGPKKVGTLSGAKGKSDAGKASAAKSGKASDKSGKAGAKDAPAEAPKEKVVPPKVDYTVTISGVTAVNSEVTDYLSKLTECPLLESVDLIYIKETDINDLELRKFEITARIRSNADARSLDKDKRVADAASEGKSSDAGKE